MKIQAHRGASGSAPENTMAAIRLAASSGVWGCEVDVQQTADGVPVLLHDKSLRRTTGKAKKIWKTTYAQLRGYDAGSWFSPDYAYEAVPALEEVIRFARGKMMLNLELKTTGHTGSLIENVARLIRQEKAEEFCLCTSFDYDAVNQIRALVPGLRTGGIFWRSPPEEYWESPHEIMSVNYEKLKEKTILAAKKAGKEIHVWTVNNLADAVKLKAKTIDSIITNYPQKLIELQD